MAFQPAPACAQAVFRFTQTTGALFAYANVLNFRKLDGTAATTDDLIDLGAVLASWDNTYAKVLRSTSYTLATIELRGLDSSAAAFATTIVNQAGTAAGEQMPLNVAACITLVTPFTGRSARGRLYHGGLAEVQSQGNSLTAGVVTGMNACYEELISTIDGEGVFKWVVLSRSNAGVVRETAVPYDIVTAGLRDAIIDTQKRRIDRLK